MLKSIWDRYSRWEEKDPVTRFYIAKDRNPTGSYNLNTFKNLIVTGDLNFDSLV